MLNIYNSIKTSQAFRKMEVNELCFVEFTCMTEEAKFGIWSDNNYFAFISEGKKIWRSIYHSYEVNDGDIINVILWRYRDYAYLERNNNRIIWKNYIKIDTGNWIFVRSWYAIYKNAIWNECGPSCNCVN